MKIRISGNWSKFGGKQKLSLNPNAKMPVEVWCMPVFGVYPKSWFAIPGMLTVTRSRATLPTWF